ncbi:MAG: hypothetical protein WBC04_25345 [Candidatus Acidiferrales bacterium]
MQAYVQNLRESYFGLGELALVGVRRALQQSRDGRLAHDVLRNIRVIPNPEELRQKLMEMQVSSEGSLSQYELQVVSILRAAEDRAKIFDLSPLPTPEEMQHNLDVANEIDRMTGGESLSLSLSDGVQWNRFQALAEANLRRDGEMDKVTQTSRNLFPQLKDNGSRGGSPRPRSKPRPCSR